ncbi:MULTISPECIES: hypothetical protein [Streptomyces]|uniref:hypothetical protein n=1 Tax=Streptomyces lycopersici TaxID=2974589 RepID=UPI0021D27FE7|nr:hypothetical protein [Streptomyces sp. NEAU-383]
MRATRTTLIGLITAMAFAASARAADELGRMVVPQHHTARHALASGEGPAIAPLSGEGPAVIAG